MWHSLTATHKRPGNEWSGTVRMLGTRETILSKQRVFAQADREVACEVVTADALMVFLLSTVDVLIELNDNAGAGGTLNLKANEPAFLHVGLDGSYLDSPLVPGPGFPPPNLTAIFTTASEIGILDVAVLMV